MRVKMCPYCGIEPSIGYNRVYCTFCYHRFQRIRQMFTRAGVEHRSIHRLHRTWNYWRRTAEMDAKYLDPAEAAA